MRRARELEGGAYNTIFYSDAIDFFVKAEKELSIKVWVVNTVLGSAVFTEGEPVEIERCGQQFFYYDLAWVDGCWQSDVYLNVRHIVTRRRLTVD